MAEKSDSSYELRIFLIVVAFAAGFFARPYYDGRRESNEILSLSEHVDGLQSDLTEAREQVGELEAELHSSQVKLEISSFAGKPLDNFDFELVCEEYAEAMCEERLYDRAQEEGDYPEPDPYEP